MRHALKSLLVAAIGIGPIVAIGALTGCEIDHHRGYAEFHDRDTYVVAPGYYYDREYYDPAGKFHKRNYYYYDGKRWDNRDAVPSGFEAHERQKRHDRHEAHDRHDTHDDHDRHDDHHDDDHP